MDSILVSLVDLFLSCGKGASVLATTAGDEGPGSGPLGNDSVRIGCGDLWGHFACTLAALLVD
jgi:hypothetical protein